LGHRSGYQIQHLTDRAPIREFLNRDRTLAAYALGDLDEAFWPQSMFYGAVQDRRLAAVVLFFRGFDPVVLAMFGEPDGARAVLEDVVLPEEISYVVPEELGGPLSECYKCPNRHTEWRMVLDRSAFTRSTLDAVGRIKPEQADLLAALYKLAAAPGEEIVAFSPSQIAHGVFYGVWVDGALVATAGTHVWSRAEGVAAIGNVFTQPDYRGRGYATACTGAVAQDAITAGLDTVILNVRVDNAPAIQVYEKLGFRRYHLFIEGPGLLKDAP
jgi:ribosomal protein S18 acetylase RimI-like enzyme